MTYGIDNGDQQLVSTPIFGQTGGGTTRSSGIVHGSAGRSATFSVRSYTMPTYGVVGSATNSFTVFTRAVAIDIYAVKGEGVPSKALEVRAKSTGTCAVIGGVFGKILDAIFRDFPGKNGRIDTVTIFDAA